MSTWYRLAPVAALLAWSTACVRHELLISTVDGNGADTYLQENAPTTANGSDPRLRVRTTIGSAGRTDITALRFDVNSVRAAVNTGKWEVRIAALQLHDARWNQPPVAADGVSFDVHLVSDGTENWDEATVAYDSAMFIADDGTPFDGPDIDSSAA